MSRSLPARVHDPAVAPSRASGREAPSEALPRLLWAALALAAVAVLAVARALSPDPSGLGTHTQLGLPGCGFLALTSLPCPGCGLTTSFAHMAQSHFAAAFAAHAVGPLLFALTALAVPLSLYACLRAWPVVETIERLRLQGLVLWVSAAVFFAWLLRLTRLFLG
ncbi:MAG: DUF2752 domain-containing protein [Myxococcales bacterium]|nr:DUF2752 domain-containing protein [Myxococcales bacterium]